MSAFSWRGALCLLLILALGLGALGCGKTGTEEDDTQVRIGVIKALGTISPYLSKEMGFFDEEGLDVEIVEFSDGPTMMEGFASGHLDMAYGGLAPAAIWNARGIPLRIVASANSGGHVIVVRQGGGVDSLEDLAGCRVATPSTGSVTDTLFRAYALGQLAGLDPDQDLSISPGMPPDAMPVALLLTREVDAIVTWEPFSARALLEFDEAHILFNFNQHWNDTYGSSYPVNVVSATESMIADRPLVLEKMLRAHYATQNFINSEPVRASEAIADELGLSVDIVTLARDNVEFTFDVSLDDAMTVLGFVHSLGYIDDLPLPGDLFDLSFQDRVRTSQ